MAAGPSRDQTLIVVDSPKDHLLLVHQADHAAASGLIAQRWQRPGDVTVDIWQRFIEAVRRHDDGWAQEERQPRLGAGGRPLDFKSIQTSDHVAVWERTLDHLEEEDPFKAVVVAQHARWLYTHLGQENIEDQRAATDFVASLSQRITRCLVAVRAGNEEERCAVEPHALTRFRVLLGLFDRISLSLLGGLPWIRCIQKVAFGSFVTSISLQPVEGGIRINPWPFSGGSWRLLTATRDLPQRKFTCEADLANKIRLAAVVQIQHHLRQSEPC